MTKSTKKNNRFWFDFNWDNATETTEINNRFQLDLCCSGHEISSSDKTCILLSELFSIENKALPLATCIHLLPHACAVISIGFPLSY